MLKISSLFAGYNNHPVINIESLAVSAGEVVALLGPSGCGKTTLFQVIAGLHDAMDGEVSLDGETEFAEIRKYVSQTLQGFPLFHWLTVKQNLELAAKIKGEQHIDLENVLKEFEATHLADKYPANISGGERCRASISQAILTKPKLLLLDEPFVGLDTLTKRSISKNLFHFADQNDVAVMMVTHDVHNAVEEADTIFVLGRQRDGVTKVYKQFDTRKTRDVNEIIHALEEVQANA